MLSYNKTITIYGIKNHMIEYIDSVYDEENDETYLDGYPRNVELIAIRDFWFNLTEENLIKVIIGDWDIDLDGARLYLLSLSNIEGHLFDYMINTLKWSREEFNEKVITTRELTDTLNEYYYRYNLIKK